jgi:hypothetical protein
MRLDAILDDVPRPKALPSLVVTAESPRIATRSQPLIGQAVLRQAETNGRWVTPNCPQRGARPARFDAFARVHERPTRRRQAPQAIWGSRCRESKSRQPDRVSPTEHQSTIAPNQWLVHPAAGPFSTSRSVGELVPPARIRRTDAQHRLMVRVHARNGSPTPVTSKRRSLASSGCCLQCRQS